MADKVLLGDCVEVMKALADASIDLICCDPPYGIDYKSNRQSVDRKISVNESRDVLVRKSFFAKIQNDKTFPIDWLPEAYRILKVGSALYVFAHWSRWAAVEAAVTSAGFHVKNMIVLNKSKHGMGDIKGSYAPKHELLLYATKGRHLLAFPNGRDKDVWDVPVKFSGAHRLHPNEKPKAWITRAILNSSREGDIVLDPFAGSGTTGVVARELKRSYLMIEVDKDHYRTMMERLNG